MKNFHVLVLLLLITIPVFSQGEDAQTISIQFSAENSADSWQAKTFQQATSKFISGYNKLKVRNFDTKMPADYQWRGILKNGSLNHELIETKTGARLSSGRFKIGQSISDLQIASLKAIKVLVRNGGLVDQNTSKKNFVLPSIPESWNRLFKIKYPQSVMSAISLVGGVLWGYILLLCLSFAVGSFHGLERIWHWNVRQYLTSWFEVFLGKIAIVFLLISPAIGLGLYLESRFELNFFLLWYALIPMIILFEFTLITLFGSVLTKILDRKFVKGNLKKNAIWDMEIRHYFMGYYRRLGLDIPMNVLNKLIFLPGRELEVFTYGGGFHRTRVVVPYELLDMAIGEPDISTAEDIEKAPVAATESLGRVLPKKWNAEIKAKSNDAQIEKVISKSKFPLTPAKAMEFPSGGGGMPMESAAGVWGQIRPNREQETVGLISDSLQDLQVVKELLSEHHMLFAKLQFDEEFDDTDPSDFDYLFGILLREVGVAHRKDSLWLTWWYSFNLFVETWPKKLKAAYSFVYGIYHSNGSRHTTTLADSYVVLHHGRHHFLQYLYYQIRRDLSLLSSRANRQSLMSVSRKIFSQFREIKPDKEDLRKNRATIKNQIIWFSKFFAFRLPDYKYKKRKPILTIIIGLLLVGTIAFEAIIALDYAPEYQKLKKEVQEKILEFQKTKGNKDVAGK